MAWKTVWNGFLRKTSFKTVSIDSKISVLWAFPGLIFYTQFFYVSHSFYSLSYFRAPYNPMEIWPGFCYNTPGEYHQAMDGAFPSVSGVASIPPLFPSNIGRLRKGGAMKYADYRFICRSPWPLCYVLWTRVSHRLLPCRKEITALSLTNLSGWFLNIFILGELPFIRCSLFVW